jgi:hypothetical protein
MTGNNDQLPALALETVDAPGAYDIREDSYHADPCPEPSLSGSVIKILANRSPRHGWAAHPKLNPDYQHKDKAAFDLGDAFHTLILGKGADLYPIDAADFRTKDAKEKRDAARAQGLTPLLKSQLERAETMAAAARGQMPAWEELNLAMTAGIPERTYIWKEETPFGEIWCRCLVDWTSHHGNLHPDWKTTEGGAGPNEWGEKVLWNLDSHIQAAWNARALLKSGLVEPALIFAVIECQFPHALAVMRPTPSAVAMAQRDIDRAIITWAWCLKHNRWPGYRPQTAWVDPPIWKEKRFLEREERGELDIGQTVELLELAAAGRAQLTLSDDSDEGERDAFGLAPIKGPTDQ